MKKCLTHELEGKAQIIDKEQETIGKGQER